MFIEEIDDGIVDWASIFMRDALTAFLASVDRRSEGRQASESRAPSTIDLDLRIVHPPSLV